MAEQARKRTGRSKPGRGAKTLDQHLAEREGSGLAPAPDPAPQISDISQLRAFARKREPPPTGGTREPEAVIAEAPVGGDTSAEPAGCENPAEAAAASDHEGRAEEAMGSANNFTEAAAERDASPEPPQSDVVELGGERARRHLKCVLESLLFVSERPVTARQLARAARSNTQEVRAVLEELAKDYQGRGIELADTAGGFQLRTSAASAPFVREFVAQKPVRLTRAQLETLAIVGYRQPVTRPELEEVRGVDSGSALRVLLDRGLLKMLGRKDEPGRPMLYGTSTAFLEFFGLRSLSDLPTLREFSELSPESRDLFQRKTGEALERSSGPEPAIAERTPAGAAPEAEGPRVESTQACLDADGAPPEPAAPEGNEAQETGVGQAGPSRGSSSAEDASTTAAAEAAGLPRSSSPSEHVDPEVPPASE